MILTENKTGNRLKKIVFISSFLISYIYLFNNMAIATAIPNVSLNINTGGTSTDMSDSIELLLFFTLLSVLPSILIMMTCFSSNGRFGTVFDIFHYGSCWKTSL